jgi:hypothetical protein
MTPRPLHEIRLRWGDHKHALWWLALLYRKPALFHEALQTGTRSQQIRSGLRLAAHALPFEVLFCILGHVLLFEAFGLVTKQATSTIAGAILLHGGAIAIVIIFGILSGITSRIIIGIVSEITFAISFENIEGITIAVTSGIAVGVFLGTNFDTIFGIVIGITVAITFGITFGNSEGIGLTIAVGIASGVASWVVGGIAPWVAFAIGFLRYYYNLMNPLFILPRVRSNWYPFHPVAWDDCCSIPFQDLDRLLAAYAEQEPVVGDKEIERLIDRYPSQRMAALRARSRLLIREAGRATDLTRLGEIVASLPQGTKGFLAETQKVGEMAGEIALMQMRLNAMDRPVFREPYAQALCSAVENFRYRVAGFHEPLASEFRVAAERWQEIAERQRDEVRCIAGREPTAQVFRAGDPVDRDREAFVPRDGVVGRLEQQVMLATGCPGVVLYGRRRMGKSTVLKNLGGFLPPGVAVAVVSMQEAEAFTSLQSLCELLGTRMREAWPAEALPGGPPADLPGLARLLTDCNRALTSRGQRLIVALDEYENIDRKIGEGVLPEDLLALMRESIQSHRNLTWVFAGSHEIEELTAAPWTSYLVSARTVEVPPFTEDETRILLTEPLKHSTLWPSDRERPHFSPDFWGEGGIARVHSEAGGWPHLVQLIAETIVDRLNESGQRQLDATLWESALDETVVRGHNVFHELLVRESRVVGELDYLQEFRTRETQSPPGDNAIARSLTRRLLVVPDGDNWRLRAPLFRRWLQRRS